jgi:hypothetical protein
MIVFEPRAYLCNHHPQNPDGCSCAEAGLTCPGRTDGCACDNCFHGLDRLAVALIAARGDELRRPHRDVTRALKGAAARTRGGQRQSVQAELEGLSDETSRWLLATLRSYDTEKSKADRARRFGLGGLI